MYRQLKIETINGSNIIFRGNTYIIIKNSTLSVNPTDIHDNLIITITDLYSDVTTLL